MRSALLLAVILIWALAAPSHSASANRIPPSKNELEGIEGYIEGKANGMVSRLVVDEAAGWVARAVAVALSSAPSNGAAPGAEALSSADLRAKIESLVSSELRERLVSEVRSMVAREILGGNSNGSAGEEAGAIAGRAAEIFSSRINEIADRMAARIYDSAVDRVRGWILSNTRGTLDVTSLSDSMEGAFDPQTVAGILENSAARLIGESAAAAVRFRIEEALAGRLPPEVIEALERGPEEFERYASMVEGNLPGAKLRELSGSVLNRPVIKLPSAAYAAILAGSAAKHYARAYNGLTVDPYELRRAIEVTRVMVWQVENRDWINLSVMQLAGIARGLARSVGAASSFEAVLEKLKGPFRKIQAAADKLDALVKKPIGEVRSEIAKAVKLLREELESVQRELLRPIREGIDEIGRGLARAGEAASDLIPEKFDGIPRTFRDLKDRAVALRSDRPSRPKLSPSADISEEEAVPAAGASESEELDPVLLHNGEFVHRATDLLIPGRGVDFSFTRICRSRSDFTGELGRRCTHSLAERLLPREGGFTLVDARGLKHFFRRSGGGFLSPPGLLADLVKTGSGHELVKPDGSVSAFDSEGRLVHRRDGYGNRIVLEYGENGLLDYAIDTYGRRITFERRKDGLISQMRDFAGRTFSYEYGALRELIGATAPATPEFPSGKTTAYRHDGAQRITMIMDPSGRPYIKNRFDSDGRVKAQSYGEGPWMTVSYAGSDDDEAGGVASRAWVTDAVGSIRLYEHDGAGRLIRRWRFEDGRYALISRHLYDSLGRKAADCLPSGICEEYVYGEGPEAGVTTGVKIRAADGESFRLIMWGPEERGKRFNSFGQVVEEDDGKGGVIRYEYYPSFDPDGDGVKVRGAAFDSTDGGYLKRIVRDCSSVEFGYDPVGNIVWSKTDSEGKVRYRVNALNQVVREERPGQAAFIYSYDANDNLVKVSTAGGKGDREFVYDRLGKLKEDRLRVRGARHAVTRYVRNAAGRLSEIVFPEGNRIAFERDGEGRRLCALRGAGSSDASKECVTRDEDGRITGFVDGDGYRTKFLRNRFGEVEEVVYPAGNRLRVERNDSGLVVGSRRMDSKGKLLSSARFEYGRSKVLKKASRLLWEEDPTKSRWIDSRPVAGSACESGEAGGDAPSAVGEPAVELNANGLVASITEGSGRKTRFFYDALDRLVLEVYPDGSERRTYYDKRDNVVRSVGRGGAVVEMDYDCAGRLIGRRLFSPNEGAEAREQRFEYDGLGRIVFAFDGNDPSDPSDDAYSRFVYDSLSRPVAEESGGGWIVREYDDEGRVAVLGLPSGENFYMSYDESGLMQSLMLGSEVLASFEYDGSGALVRKGLGENLSLEIKRDEGGRIIALSYVRTGGYLEGGQELMFGADGRVSMESGLYGLDRIYARDLEGRLISAKDGYFSSDSMDPYMAGGSFRGWRYDYGADGSVERVGTQPGEGSSPRVVYDKAGNVESIGELGFSYDALGRLVGVSKGGSPLATYVYDAFDRRVAKRLAGEERRFVWDGFRLVREYGPEGSGSSFAYGATGNPPAVALYGRRRLYPMPDRLGSVTAVAGADGMAVARCGFGPYGEPVPAVPDGMPGMDGKSPDFGGCSSMPLPFGFAGHVRDDETGLVYMRYRYYSPSIMRFMTPDPLGYRVVARGAPLIKVFPTPAYHRGQGGASSATFPNRPLGISADYDVFPFGRADMAPLDIRAPGLMNLYSYAEGDPSTFVDPLGLASLLFDRSDETLALVMDNGIIWGSFSASNRATRPNADPLQVGGNGPFPNGTYSVGLPEFYSDRYREEVTINYELGILAPWETLLTGRHWKKDRKDSEGYSAPYGRIRIRAGSPSDGAMWSRGLFIHGGRHDYRKRTLGCIRVDDADLELLAVGMINLARDGDPVTHISVQD